MTAKQEPCPCGGATYAECCGRFHEGARPDTAEQLMRSRYSAYVLGLTDYLQRTWHASTRPAREELSEEGGAKWLGLEVKRHVPAAGAGGADDADGADKDKATVEFVARYKVGGRAHRLHEISRFVREDGQWYYVDGSFPDSK